MIVWVAWRRLRQCVMCKENCDTSTRVMLCADYVTLYGMFFLFMWYLIVSMIVHLAQFNWMDPDALEGRFPSVAGERRLSEQSGPDAAAVQNRTSAEPAFNWTNIPQVNNSTNLISSTTTSWPASANITAANASSTTAVPAHRNTSTMAEFEARCNYSVVDVTSGIEARVQEIIRDVSMRPVPFARWAGIFAPWAVGLTWCVCAWETWKHARAIWWRTGVVEHHDLVIQIVALPMVYSLMALSAVLRMWKVMSNSFDEKEGDWLDTWERRQKKALQIYEADYAVADLYESWALHHFAVLAMTVLKQSFNSASQMLERSAETLDTNSPLYQAWAGTLKGMHKSVSNLAMLGVWSFVIACACASCYVLSTIVVQEAMGEDSTTGVLLRDNTEKMSFFNYGMGCVASSVAICNMIQIEKTFRVELLDFSPFLKFWGTKILVSLAFLQTIVFMVPVPPFETMSTVQMNLTYSTLICYECLLISLLHMYAWRANEDWYKDGLSVRSPTGGLAPASTVSLAPDHPWPFRRDAGFSVSVLGRRGADDNSGPRNGNAARPYNNFA